MARSNPKGVLTDAMIEQADQLLRAGNYITTVAQYLGVHRATWYDWLSKGQALLDEHTTDGVIDWDSMPPDRRRYADLVDTVQTAEAAAEVRLVTHLSSAAGKDWRAAATMLAVKYPERWSQNPEVRLRVEGAVEHHGTIRHTTPAALEQAAMSDDYRTAAILAALDEAGALPPGVLEAATVEVLEDDDIEDAEVVPDSDDDEDAA